MAIQFFLISKHVPWSGSILERMSKCMGWRRESGFEMEKD